ncbi:hypothetical protein PtB15_6B834 [Puccinia triticina]|nr:hypothetical protein PtB15_6B834 [Puccinia triticina]
MALAFFSAPLLGFGKPAAAPDASKDRPESMSAEAIIKCSDCGGDVILAQLGEHVCLPAGQLPSIPEDEQAPPDTDNIPPKPPELEKPSTTDLIEQPSQDAPANPTPLSSQSPPSIGQSTSSTGSSTTSSSSASTASTSLSTPQTSNQSSTSTSLESLKEKLLNSIRPEPKPASSSSSNSEPMAPKSKATTSSSEYSFSNSDTSSSSNSSSGRVPFFERYAQLMPKTTTSEAKATVKEAENEKDELVFPPKKQMSPITSPEPSPLQTKKIQVPETTPKHSSPDRFGQHHYEVDTPRKYPSAYPDDTPKFHTRQPSDPSTHSPTPSSPGIRPSDSISQLGYTRSPSPKLTKTARVPRGDAERMCQRCMEAPIRHVKNPKTDEARLCSACYAEVYLPKCRKCSKPIERGAVTDRVGKVLGKYHASCFNCFQCNAPFPNGEFYVWERRPVCSKHYHRLAGTTCCNQSCGRGIEGPCVSLFLDGSQTGSVVSDDSTGSNPISNSARRKLYHPEHFSCSRRGCTTSLHEFHFVVNKQPWCERHALQEEDSLPRPLGLAHHYPLPPSSRDPRAPPFDPRQPHPSSRMPPDPRAAANQPPRRMERRRTIIQNVRSR